MKPEGTRMKQLDRPAWKGHRRARSLRAVAAVSVAGLFGAASVTASAQDALPLQSIKLPPGFTIEVAARVANPRAMTWGAAGTLFVGSANAGTVYALTLPPPGANAQSPGEAVIHTIATGLREPAGVAFR